MRAMAIRAMIRRIPSIAPEVLRIMGATRREIELIALIEDEIVKRNTK